MHRTAAQRRCGQVSFGERSPDLLGIIGCELGDARLVSQELGNAGADEGFEIIGRHALSGCAVELVGPRDVVAIALAGLGRVARAHASCLAIEQHAGEQA